MTHLCTKDIFYDDSYLFYFNIRAQISIINMAIHYHLLAITEQKKMENKTKTTKLVKWKQTDLMYKPNSNVIHAKMTLNHQWLKQWAWGGVRSVQVVGVKKCVCVPVCLCIHVFVCPCVHVHVRVRVLCVCVCIS